MAEKINKSDSEKAKKSDVDVTSEAASAESYDAHQVAEAIEEGEQSAPNVDLDADYEASKKLSGSQSGEKAVTASMPGMPNAEATNSVSASTGNPDDYREMAKQVTPAPEAEGDSSEPVKKASKQGQKK